MSLQYIIRFTYRLTALLLLLMQGSCNKFLEEKPSKGSAVVIETAADLDALLSEFATFYRANDNVAIFGSDDNGFSSAMYDARSFAFDAATVQFSLWDIDNLPETDRSNFSGNNFWGTEYSKIFNANIVLANLPTVTGSEELKAKLKADAHFVRAYSYWQLANTYCLPYSGENGQEPGLPIKLEPDYIQVPRSTLDETYRQIEADLAEALKTTVPLVQNGQARHWRASIAGVNAFAARFYLHRGDYAKAIQHANASLADYNILVDYNTDMSYGPPISVVVNGQPETIDVPYTYQRTVSVDPTDALGWKEFLYYRVLSNSNNWFIPSDDLVSLYDQAADLRYKYHIIPKYSYIRGFTMPPSIFPGYVFFSSTGMPEGPTVAEVLLTKAECLARTGDAATAMQTVNLLYSKRTVGGTPELTAASEEEAVAVILQERRREMPFGHRWFDIRRLNNNESISDDVSLTKIFYPYTATSVLQDETPKTYSLPKGSRRFASPIPGLEVINSDGLIKQNTY